jgi:hypothetical protein
MAKFKLKGLYTSDYHCKYCTNRAFLTDENTCILKWMSSTGTNDRQSTVKFCSVSDKGTNHQVLIRFQQNWLKKEVVKFALRSLNLLFLFGIKRNCLISGRSQSFYLFIRRVIKQTVVTIVAYHSLSTTYKILSNILLSSLTQLLGMISVGFDVTGQQLIIYSAFVKYSRKNGSTVGRCISCL